MIRNLKQLVELIAILQCIAGLYGKKFKIDIYAILYLACNILIFEGMNTNKIPIFFLYFLYLSLFIYALFAYKDNWKITLLNCFLTIVIMSIMQMIVYLPVYYLMILPNGIKEQYDLLINMVCWAVVVVFDKKWKLEGISRFFLEKNRIIKGCLGFVLLCVGNGIYQVKKLGHVSGKDCIQIVSFTVLLFWLLYEWHKVKIDSERKKMQLEMNELYYSAYDELITLVRERQHDMKNHINAIYGMIYTIDNYEDLVRKQKEYCQYMLDKNEETKLLLSAGNPLLAGFLYKKGQEAEAKGIGMEYKIAVDSSQYNIPEYELVEVIGILVDNAIEALELLQNNMKKIRINITCNKGNMSIEVANSSKDIESNKIEEFFRADFSSKGSGRGIGLSKLKKMVKKRNGEIVVSNEEYDNTNFLQFMILLPVM